MSERPRRFFLPLIGFMLLFAAFGPAIGGVLFAPIVVVLAAQYGAEAAGSAGGFAAVFGHGLALVFAYVVGVGPAAAAGFVYGLWDAAAPAGAPRALAAAIIGGAITYCVYLWLASLGASFEASVGADVSAEFAGVDRSVVSARLRRDAARRAGRLRRRRGPRLRDGGEPDRPDDARRARARARAAGALGRRLK